MAQVIHKEIGRILIEQGLISEQQLKEALEEQRVTNEKLGEVFVRRGWLKREDLERVLLLQSGISKLNIADFLIEAPIIKLVPEEFARKYKLMPVFLIDNTLTVAMVDPTNVFIIDELRRFTKYDIEPVWVEEIDLNKAQDQYYGGTASLQEIISSINKEKLLEDEKLGEEAPIIKIVNHLIIQAVQAKASDIHIEPDQKLLGVRYRLDGVLHSYSPLPKDLTGAIISRFKIIAGLDIAEKRLPQDGRILMKIGNKDIDFRVSTCPTVHGENVVLRILDKSGLVLGLASLGFSKEQLQDFREILTAPYGIILVTGPTGSGKTTTLYSALQILNKEGVNIMTVEDPVEYEFTGIRQVHVNIKAGLTFAVALRSFLRQDPNIIMVGEIRDRETAEIAVQAALTGHLVFSTLHTNDAPTAFTRLIDMGVEPFLVSSSILGILAQRLVRKVCERCKESFKPSADMLKNLGLEDKVGNEITFNRGKGCQLCSQTGYKGRIGIFELLKKTSAIEELVLRKASADEIAAQALKDGMLDLRAAALDKLLHNITTPEEVSRVTLESE